MAPPPVALAVPEGETTSVVADVPEGAAAVPDGAAVESVG